MLFCELHGMYSIHSLVTHVVKLRNKVKNFPLEGFTFATYYTYSFDRPIFSQIGAQNLKNSLESII